MTTGLVLDIYVGHVVGRHGAVHQHGVAVVDDGVVLAVHQENGALDAVGMALHRQRIAHHMTASTPFAQQSAAAALMRNGMRKRHHGIDGCDEVGPQGAGEVFGRHQRQVTTGRKAHNAYVAIAFCTDKAHGPFDGPQLIGVLPTRKIEPTTEGEACPTGGGIMQHVGRYALAIEPSGHLATFVFLAQPAVAAPRTHDDGRAAGVARLVNFQSAIVWVALLCANGGTNHE